MLNKRLIGLSLLLLFCICLIGMQSLSAQQKVVDPIPKQERTTTGGPTKISQQQPRTNSQQKTSNIPVINANEIKPQINNTKSDKPYNYEKANLEIQAQLSNSTKKIANLTLCLVVVGFIQAIIIGIQIIFLRGTLNATAEAANAATKAAKVAEDSLQIGERAYLSVDDFKIDLDTIQVGSRIRIDYEIKNTGHTFAQIIEITQTISFINIHDSLPKPNYSICKTSYYDHFIWPFGHNPGQIVISDNSITPQQFKDINSGECCIAIWGKIIYKDIFKKHWVVGFGKKYNVVFKNYIFMEGFNHFDEYNSP